MSRASWGLRTLAPSNREIVNASHHRGRAGRPRLARPRRRRAGGHRHAGPRLLRRERHHDRHGLGLCAQHRPDAVGRRHVRDRHDRRQRQLLSPGPRADQPDDRRQGLVDRQLHAERRELQGHDAEHGGRLPGDELHGRPRHEVRTHARSARGRSPAFRPGARSTATSASRARRSATTASARPPAPAACSRRRPAASR